MLSLKRTSLLAAPSDATTVHCMWMASYNLLLLYLPTSHPRGHLLTGHACLPAWFGFPDHVGRQITDDRLSSFTLTNVRSMPR
nr:unnamed protein product [Digitaria exilis]